MRTRIAAMDGFTDISASGWVRHLPRRLIPYAILARFDRLIGAWLLFLPGLWAIILAAQNVSFGLWLVVLFAAGSVVMRGAGCVVNDLWDRKLDAAVTRTAGRPLASGVLTPLNAFGLLAILSVVGLLILLQLNFAARVLGVASLLPVALYPLAKRVTWWPQMVLGVVFGWGAPMGFAAASGIITLPALPLSAAAFLWILGYDTIYAHQDREDDALIGVKSSARRLGTNTRPFLAFCYAGAILALAIAMRWAGLGWFGVFALSLPASLLARQITQLDIDNPALCLRLFKSNREVGLAIALAIAVGRLA